MTGFHSGTSTGQGLALDQYSEVWVRQRAVYLIPAGYEPGEFEFVKE